MYSSCTVCEVDFVCVCSVFLELPGIVRFVKFVELAIFIPLIEGPMTRVWETLRKALICLFVHVFLIVRQFNFSWFVFL